jgi:putative nucleotidyltransferase with HDIG domain
MIKVYTSDLEKGMVLQSDAVTADGKVLLSQGMILTDNAIRRISSSDIEYVFIVSESQSIEITGTVTTESGEEQAIDSTNVEIKSLADVEAQELVEDEMNQLSETMKAGILNLNLSEDQIMKNTGDASATIRDSFTKNTKEVLSSILTVRDIDEYLYRHSVNVSVISFMLAKWMGYDDEKLDKLVQAALLHDIGKLKVPQEILHKPGKLTDEEFVIMKKHAAYTYSILKEFKDLDPEILNGAAFHHEKLDGSGYPLGLKADRIPEFAKIIAVADIFDAMTSDRVYHKKKSPFKVLEMFENSSFGKLDIKVTMLFVKRFVEYYIGVNVILSDGKTAKIIRLNINEVTKPLIMTDEGSFIDMSLDRNIEISDFVAGEADALIKSKDVSK